jgi:hypothetical protein
MSVNSLSPHEIEQDRQRRARELSAESGDDWAEGYQPGSAGCHELLDRAALIADMLERHVLDHPACVARPDWYLLANQAVTSLHELYQQVGAEHLSAERAEERHENTGMPGR